MKEIRMKSGRVAMVDDDLYDTLNQYHWNDGYNSYAVCRLPAQDGLPAQSVPMHQAVAGISLYGLVVDHVNTRIEPGFFVRMPNWLRKNRYG